MGKSSGGIRNAGKNTRKKLTSEQSKEFHNAAALGLFNSAVGKGGEPFKDLSYFEKLANNYNSFEDFYNDVSKMNNISIEVSNDFRKKYKNNYNDTPKNALLNLFNAQKKPSKSKVDENLLKSVNFEKPKKSDYDKIKKAIELDFKKRNSFISNKL